MSHTETHIGKLKKVIIKDGSTIEDWCREKCLEIGKSVLSSYNENWIEQCKCSFSQKYFFLDGCIWEAVEHKELDSDPGSIYEMYENEDGTVSFVMQFYNGGTCLTECIEEELIKFK